MTTKTTLLIDEYLFKACAAIEMDIKWDKDNHVLMSNEKEAWDNFIEMVRRVADRFGVSTVTDTILCFTDKSAPNFRLAVDPEYKSNRKGARKPLCYATIKQLACEHYKTQSFPALEADDVIGILATRPGANAIIVSQDKDMKTTPPPLWDGGRTCITSQ